ncbi:hypothetical protein GCM10027160_00980 [Streptomyces calidiresistens]|uniref:Uncharacterized protein n=1 Tax=Streptomyces calidiresistens TaxID=1485586 RepID=A0A7W3XXJ8_9ACTN|nr:hypothetical protein [Streptomyces calidiresistens]MBB0230902.1 hypothetical protein [Streptomyces calidiresistens]
MRQRPVTRAVVLGSLTVLLVTGCGTDPVPADPGTGADDAVVGEVPGEPVGASSPAGEAPFVPNPERLPRDATAAAVLAAAVLPDPADHGTGFVAVDRSGDTDPDTDTGSGGRDTETGDTGTQPVLTDACVWKREPISDDVLALRTVEAERPADPPSGDPPGAITVVTVVTVHDEVTAADRRMAGILEEGLRCPEQRLRADEWIAGLTSVGAFRPGDGALPADDLITERGDFFSEEHGGPHPYLWLVARVGPVTAALAVKGTDGSTEGELTDLAHRLMRRMITAAHTELS